MEERNETQETAEEKKSESPATEENQDKSPLEQAQESINQLRAENDRKEKLLEREERLRGAEMLGGKSAAGMKQEKVEETDREYAEKVMAGESV